MTTNGEWLERINKHMEHGTSAEAMTAMLLGPDVPTVEDIPDTFTRYVKWEMVAVYALLQRKRALSEVIVEHLAGLDPDEETKHPCGDEHCGIATKEAHAGEMALGILSGQMVGMEVEPKSVADIIDSSAGSRLADEVEAYVREHGEGGYL